MSVLMLYRTRRSQRRFRGETRWWRGWIVRRTSRKVTHYRNVQEMIDAEEIVPFRVQGPSNEDGTMNFTPEFLAWVKRGSEQ